MIGIGRDLGRGWVNWLWRGMGKGGKGDGVIGWYGRTRTKVWWDLGGGGKKRGGREELIVDNLHTWRKETFQSQILFSPVVFRLSTIIATF